MAPTLFLGNRYAIVWRTAWPIAYGIAISFFLALLSATNVILVHAAILPICGSVREVITPMTPLAMAKESAEARAYRVSGFLMDTY